MEYPFIPYQPESHADEELLTRSKEFYDLMSKRRSVRQFSDKPVSRQVMEKIIMTAATAPSGAHKQPWTFCLVGDADMKKKIREAAEKEEYESYHHRMSDEWLRDLAPLGTDWHKEFLEIVPWIIVVFKRVYELHEGTKLNNYYVNESVGIATGFLLAAIHHAGLSTLTHTPSPMNFLTTLLQRPENERPFLLLPVGHAAENCLVPDLHRKELSQVMVHY